MFFIWFFLAPPKKCGSQEDIHSLTHVRYTPHHTWQDNHFKSYQNVYSYFDTHQLSTHYLHMIKDAQRYMPMLGQSKHVNSLWEIKTLLPQSECDDSRPILFKQHLGCEGLTTIMGGKIDNIFDINDKLKNHMKKEH